VKRCHRLVNIVYICFISVSSLAVLFGMHRDFYAFLHRLSAPDWLVSSFTGLLNLAWYEVGYVVGGGLKNVHLFLAIPLIGSITGLVSAVALVPRWNRRRIVVLFHIGLSLTLAAASIAVLVWRFVRGIEDEWRLVTSFAFAFLYAVWFAYFYRTRSEDDA